MSRSREVSNVVRYDISGRTVEHVRISASRVEGSEHVHIYIDNGKRQQRYYLTRSQLRELIATPILEEGDGATLPRS